MNINIKLTNVVNENLKDNDCPESTKGKRIKNTELRENADKASEKPK